MNYIITGNKGLIGNYLKKRLDEEAKRLQNNKSGIFSKQKSKCL